MNCCLERGGLMEEKWLIYISIKLKIWIKCCHCKKREICPQFVFIVHIRVMQLFFLACRILQYFPLINEKKLNKLFWTHNLLIWIRPLLYFFILIVSLVYETILRNAIPKILSLWLIYSINNSHNVYSTCICNKSHLNQPTNRGKSIN